VAAIGCLLVALLSGLGSRSARLPSQYQPVLVAVRALAAGHSVVAADLSAARWPSSGVPLPAVREVAGAVGRRLATSIERGQPLLAGALLEPAIAAALAAGRVATTIMLADANQAAIVATGAHVDLYRGSGDGVLVDGGAPARPSNVAVARNAIVLAVLPSPGGTANPMAGNAPISLVIATDSSTAGRLAQQLPATFLATLVAPS
jgi:Flp pilus assembly protein CpaB